MTERLKNILVEIDFKNRFDILFEKHSHRNLFKKADPQMVQEIIEKLGYGCTYHKSGKFFKVDKAQSNLSLNLSTDIGIVEFILDAIVDGEGTGGPFDYMCTFISDDENLKAPRFSSYEELEEILKEGFSIYEDIKRELIGSGNQQSEENASKSILEEKLDDLITKLKESNKPSYQYFEDVLFDLNGQDQEGALKRLKSCFSITERANFTREETELLSEIIGLV